MMTNRKRSLLNLASASFGQLMMIAIGFLLPRLFITSFGSEVNGLLSSANQILVYLAIFEAGVGGVTLQALYGPVARQDWGKINGILSATNTYYKKTSLLYGLTLVAVSALYPLVVAIDQPHATVSLIIFLVGLPQVVSFYIQAKFVLLLKADGKNYILTLLSTLISVLAGLAKVFLILQGMDVLPVIIAQCVIQLLQAWYIDRYMKKHYPQISLDAKPDYEAISQKNYMLVHQLGALVYHNTDVLLLSVVSGLKVVSVYSIYKLVMSQLGNLLFNIQNSVDFILGQTYQTDRAKYIRRIDQFESWFSALAFSVYGVIFFALYSFVRLYTSGVEDVVYADRLLVLMFVSIELLSAMRQPMQQTINYAGHFKNTLPQTLIETGLKLVISLIGVAIWGIYGVLAGTIISQLYRVNDVIFYANTKLLRRGVQRTYSIHAINFLVFIIAQLLFSAIFPDITTWKDFVTVGILAGCISLPLFLAAQTLAWPDNRASLRYYLKNSRQLFQKVFKKQGK